MGNYIKLENMKVNNDYYSPDKSVFGLLYCSSVIKFTVADKP